jgi:hypothetical protein
VPSQDPQVRSLVGKIGRFSRAAGAPPKQQAPDAIVPADQRSAYLAEVDPEGVLPLRERQRRAAAAYKRDEAVAALAAYRAGIKPDGVGPDAA